MTTWQHQPPFAHLFRRGRGTVARADTEWDSIMVQITLAFVIILGYLVSKGITESQNLAAETAMQRKQNQRLEKIVADFSDTEEGRERSKRLAAERENQLLKLLRRWTLIRDQRLFHQLIAQYRHAEHVPLSDDLQSLPTASSFNDLNQEIDRIFRSEQGDVSPDELEKLMNEVLTAEGYDLGAVSDLRALEQLSREAADQDDDSQTPTLANLNALRSQIEGDLIEERRQLVDIQYDLVDRIAGARLEKLASLPLSALGEVGIDVSAPDLGNVVREQILKDLRSEVRLLPETEARIRGTSGTATTTEQDQDAATE